jgi:hypothetical protein
MKTRSDELSEQWGGFRSATELQRSSGVQNSRRQISIMESHICGSRNWADECSSAWGCVSRLKASVPQAKSVSAMLSIGNATKIGLHGGRPSPRTRLASCLPSFPAETNSSVAYLQGKDQQAYRRAHVHSAVHMRLILALEVGDQHRRRRSKDSPMCLYRLFQGHCCEGAAFLSGREGREGES